MTPITQMDPQGDKPPTTGDLFDSLRERLGNFLEAMDGAMSARPKVVNEEEYKRLVKQYLPEFAGEPQTDNAR